MSKQLTDKFKDLALDVLEKQVKLLECEKKILEQQVLYWRVEAQCYEGRWLMVLEDLDKYKKERRDNGNNS